MKKYFLLFVLNLFSLMALAQIKVAILETVDKEGQLSYAVKLMVRSHMTKAISGTPGFEGYDRVNMSQIMSEQDFQRTGMVNEEQIKKLGEMCGADFILVSEAVKFDDYNIYVTATILNVETAQAVGAENKLMGTTAKEIEKGCQELANQLFGSPQQSNGSFFSSLWNRLSGDKLNGKQQKKEESPAKEEPKVAEQPKVVEQPQKAQPSETEKELITFKKYFHYLGDKRLTEDDYMDLIKNCPEANLSYERGRRQKRNGNAWLITGLTTIAIGGGIAAYGAYMESHSSSNNYDNPYDPYWEPDDYWEFENTYNSSYFDAELYYNIGGVVASVGVLSTLISLPIKASGKAKMRKAYKKYNTYCAQPPTILSFGATRNGVGVSLNF